MLIVASRQYSTSSVAISDSGMVIRLISAARHSYRNDTRITSTSRKPSSSASVRLWIEVLMKLACRKMCVSKTTFGRPGCRDLITSSTPWVTCKRVAPRQLLDHQQQTRPVVHDGVAGQRLVVLLDGGHRPDRHVGAVPAVAP